MSTFKFDIMLNGRFVCILRYKYYALFPIDFEDLKKFILSKKPSLKGKDYRIAVQLKIPYKDLSFYGCKVLVVKCNSNRFMHITVCEDSGMF